jgi:hypothetical protein
VRRVLVLGVPRSATTWVATVLASAPGSELVMEPDNEKSSLLAALLKKGVSRFPELGPGAEPPAGYALLWRLAFQAPRAVLLSRSRLTRALLAWWARQTDLLVDRRGGGPGGVTRALVIAAAGRDLPPGRGGVRVVKSVHAVLAAEWLLDAFRPDTTVVVSRHPLGTLASWRKLEMPDATRLAGAASHWLTRAGLTPPDPVSGVSMEYARMCLTLAYLQHGLDRAVAKHPEWVVVGHETLCGDPQVEFHALSDRCHLPWGPEAAEALAVRDRPGTGYRPVRDSRSEVGKWRSSISPEEADHARRVFHLFGLPEVTE